MSLSQNDSGRALEYGIANALSSLVPASIQNTIEFRKAEQCYNLSESEARQNIHLASHEICMFLIAHDDRLSETGCMIRVQSDQEGQYGDVRDVIVNNTTIHQEIGISAKHRHAAVKHSRLSEEIDFGSGWLGLRCSDEYFHQVTPIFRELRSRKRRGEYWRDIPDKKQRFYMPILQAFQTEIQTLFDLYPDEAPKRLVQYLLGKFDYYKVIKHNGSVSVMSFNISGSLKWGSKMPLPTSIIRVEQKRDSETTIFMTFDKGWQLSFRIHNASSLVEPSLKFDINIVGMPQAISRHEIKYLG